MRGTKELLQQLSDKISEVYNVDLAEEMTGIFIDLSNNINEMSDRYWSLVKSRAIIEKQRDELRSKGDESAQYYV